MTHELVRIDFEQFLADPQRVFDQVMRDGNPVLVERNGHTYRLEHEPTLDLWRDYDPAIARQGLRAAVGALDGVEIEELLVDLRHQRSQNSLGRPA